MTSRSRSKLTVLSIVMAVSLFVPLHEAVIADHGEGLPGTVGSPMGDGAAVYGSKCALCHGKDGAGLPNWRSKGQPDFTKSDWQEAHTDLEITEAIKNGKGKYMPAFKNKLSEDDMTALVQRVRGFRKGK